MSPAQKWHRLLPFMFRCWEFSDMATAHCKGVWERWSSQVPRKQKMVCGGQLVLFATSSKNLHEEDFSCIHSYAS